jgi:hypothetical protein
LQAENQLLKDRLNPSSTSVDENILLKSVTNFSQSPSAPNSPTRFVRNALSVQSVSVPSSPRNHHHHEDTVINLTTAPPLTLPPQQQHHHHHHPPIFTSSTPPPSSIISAHSNTSSPVPASTESCTSSPSISNVLIPTVTSGYHNYHGYHYNSPPVAALSVSIPQPPQLYNYKQQQQQQQQHPEAVQFKQTNNKPGTPPGLRPLLPATNKYPQQQQHPPSVRMSGYEKIYGNVCRY